MVFSEKLTDLESLEMAKKRNCKIAITNEAIEKVPFIRYKEIPEEEYPITRTMFWNRFWRQPFRRSNER